MGTRLNVTRPARVGFCPFGGRPAPAGNIWRIVITKNPRHFGQTKVRVFTTINGVTTATKIFNVDRPRTVSNCWKAGDRPKFYVESMDIFGRDIIGEFGVKPPTVQQATRRAAGIIPGVRQRPAPKRKLPSATGGGGSSNTDGGFDFGGGSSGNGNGNGETDDGGGLKSGQQREANGFGTDLTGGAHEPKVD